MTPTKVEEALAVLRSEEGFLRIIHGEDTANDHMEALATITAAIADAEAAAKDRDEQIKFATDAAIEAQTALAERERDAARYRWLRDNKWADIFYRHDHETHKHDANSRFCCDLLDTAIDAMKDTDHAR